MNNGFDRVLFKERAKSALKGRYWMAFLASLISGILMGNWNSLTGNGGVSFSNNFQIKNASENGYTFKQYYTNLQQGYVPIGKELISIWVLLAMVVVFSIIMFVVIFAIGSFLGAPMNVAQKRYYMKSRIVTNQPDITDIFSSFSPKYMKIVKTMFLYNIKIWAWSLLLWIPGIIKYYEYYFVPYIMSENPDIDAKRAFEISKYMTKGKKWDIFIVELSFIGWILLSIIVCCGISAVFLTPYIQATYAEMYEERREMALATGFATEQELIDFQEIPVIPQ